MTASRGDARASERCRRGAARRSRAARKGARTRTGAGRNDLDLPDASRDPPRRVRDVPDLRHGARAADRRQRDGGRKRRAQGHDAPVLDRRRAHGAAALWRCSAMSPRRSIRCALFGTRGRVGRSSLLATPVVLWGGWPFFVRGWQSIVNRSLEHVHADRARDAAPRDLYSVVATVVPGVFPAAFRDEHGAPPVYFEAAAVIVTLVLLGQVLELRARSADVGRDPRAARARAEDRAPRRRRRHGARRAARRGRASATGCACARARSVPVDGVVLEGASHVDESMLTGEPMPVREGGGRAASSAGTIERQRRAA